MSRFFAMTMACASGEQRLATISELLMAPFHCSNNNTDEISKNLEALLTYLPRLRLRKLSLWLSRDTLITRKILFSLRAMDLQELHLCSWNTDMQSFVNALQQVPLPVRRGLHVLQVLRSGRMGPDAFDDDLPFDLPHLPSLRHCVIEYRNDLALRKFLGALPSIAPNLNSLQLPSRFPALRNFLCGPSAKQLRHLYLTTRASEESPRDWDPVIPDLRTLCPRLETFAAYFSKLSKEDVERLPPGLKFLHLDAYSAPGRSRPFLNEMMPIGRNTQACA